MDWFYEGLKSDDVATRTMCLQALKNVVLPDIIDDVLGLLESEEDMSVVEVALEVLEKFEPEHFSRKVSQENISFPGPFCVWKSIGYCAPNIHSKITILRVPLLLSSCIVPPSVATQLLST